MYRVLIIGCGRIAGGFDEAGADDAPARTHAGAYRAHGGFELVGCVEPDAGRRQAFAGYWNVAHATASVAEQPAGDFDVVSICSPTAAHAADIESALALKPRLIFCEKPVSLTVDETETLVRRCAGDGVLLGVNYTRRWSPDLVGLAAALQAGEWGAVRSVSGIYTKGAVHNGSHMIDLLHLLLGPVELVAAGSPVFDFWDDDPSVAALLVTATGIPVTLAAGDARDYAHFELTVLTERGEIAMRDGGLSWTERLAGASEIFAGYRALGPFVHRPGRYDEAMPAAVANIAAALDSGAPLAATGETALAAQTVCEQMRDAALSRIH